jgi:hypothetical protein
MAVRRSLLGVVLVFTGLATPVLAQNLGKSGGAVMPPTMAAPPSVKTPSATIPSAVPSAPSAAPSVSPPAAVSAPSAVPSQQVPTCRRPEDCREDYIEEARRKFAECVEKSRVTQQTFYTPALEECVLGFMSPNKFAEFKQCLSASGNLSGSWVAWDCYRQAYR